MAACPNCGRQTLRTKDWACQWCGYPLISRAFKSIDKTFKELQEERSRASLTVDADMDTGPGESLFEAETETAPEPEPEPEKRPEPKQKPKFRLFSRREPIPRRPGIEPRSEPAPAPESRPQPRPVYRRPEPPPDTVRAAQVEPVSKPEPVKPIYQPPPDPAPSAETVAPPDINHGPVAGPEPVEAPPPVVPEPPKPRPEIVVEPPPPPVSSIKPDDIKDGMEISVDDMDALFRLDKSGTNMRLNGKTVILKGIVEKVFIREHLEIRYIVIKGRGRSVWSARCTFEKENAAKASRLNEGQEVAVRAKYDGYGKNVIFKDCEVV